MQVEEQSVQAKEDHSHPVPDIRSLFDGPINIRSIALTGIFILLVFYSLYFARPFLIPIVLAVLLNFLLSPIVRFLRKLRIPETAGAAIVVVAVLGITGYAVYRLAAPASEWFRRVPATIRNVEAKVRTLQRPVQEVTEAAEKMEKMTGGAERGTRTVQLQQNTLSERLFAGAWQFVASAFILIVLLYFLLASGDMFLRKLVKVLPGLREKKIAVEVARTIEDHISRYLLTITAINTCLGIAIGTALGLLGVPNPVLWGIMAGLFNFVPYLGGAVGVSILTVVSLLTFDSVGYALLAPAAYLAINGLEGNVITPIIVGKRLMLNPVVIFVCLIFWGWMWGVLGAFLAVPMVATFKILCDHIEPLASIGEFLGQ